MHTARFDFAFSPAGNAIIQAYLVPCRFSVGPPVGVPRMSKAPPSVPRFGSDFGLVRRETGASEDRPGSPRFPLGPPGAVSRISEAPFSVQTGPVLHPRRTEGIREARQSERFPVYSKGPPRVAEDRRAPVSKVGPSQTRGFGCLGR